MLVNSVTLLLKFLYNIIFTIVTSPSFHTIIIYSSIKANTRHLFQCIHRTKDLNTPFFCTQLLISSNSDIYTNSE